MSTDQRALWEWWQASGKSAWYEERWLWKNYGVRKVVHLTDEQARAALARLQAKNTA